MAEEPLKAEQLVRRWFEWYCSRSSGGTHQPPRKGMRYACPCCGYPTLTERGGDEICELCNWEDDGQDDPYVDEVWGGPNYQYSLTQARENFQRYWIMWSPDDPCKSGRSNSPVELQAKQAIAAAFDAMPEADEEERGRLWDVIIAGEETLKQELNRRVREMQAIRKSHV